jgi:carbon monoxide dehydrogenase subunit G
MEIRETFEVNAPPDVVARVLLDVPTVAACVPGVQDIKRDEDGSWAAVMTAQMGPIKASFAGTIAVDGAEAPERLRATGEGRDRKTGSQASVSMVATLSSVPEEATKIEVVADVAIRGRLGQFGTGIIRATASEMTKAFAECLAGKVESRPDPADPSSAAVAGEGPAAEHRSATPQVSVLVVLLRGLRSWGKAVLVRAWTAISSATKGKKR